MNRGKGVLIGWIILLAACESDGEPADSAPPSTDIPTVEAPIVAETAAVAPPPAATQPGKPQEIDQPAAPPSATPIDNIGQPSTPEPAITETSVQSSEPAPPEVVPKPVVVTVPPPKQEKEEEKEEIEVPPADTTPPAFAGLKSARVVSTTEVVLSWEPSEEPSVTYRVCVGGSAGACKTLFTIAFEAPAGSKRAFIPDLDEDATYYFVVRAVDAVGNTSTNEIEKRAVMKRGLTLAYRLDGPMNGWLGYSLSGVDDRDGDEKPDLLVGAPMAEFGGEMSGTVFLYSGADGSPLLQLDGDEPAAGLGASVFLAGDVNSDGIPDFGAGAPLHGAMDRIFNGESVVFSGSDGSFLSAKTGPKGSYLGERVENLGDVNSDGKSDCAWILFDAPEGESAVDVGPCDGATDSLLYSVRNPSQGDAHWTRVAPAGDVDRDGQPDFLVGDPAARGSGNGMGKTTGRVDLLSGMNGGLIRSIFGSEDQGKFGSAAASLGDVNGDGFPDVAIGVPGAQVDGTFWVGRVCVHSGADGKEIYCRNGDKGFEAYGAVVVPAQDFNDDGKGDFAVAAVGRENSNSSYVEIVSGADGGLLHRIEDPGSDTWFGLAMAVADLDGDARLDLIVGAPHAKPDGVSFAGSVYVYITQ